MPTPYNGKALRRWFVAAFWSQVESGMRTKFPEKSFKKVRRADSTKAIEFAAVAPGQREISGHFGGIVMFTWFWQHLGFSRQDMPDQIEYDSVYGLSRRAIDEWLAMNPRLAAEHKVLEKLARDRRNKAAGKPGYVSARVGNLNADHRPE